MGSSFNWCNSEDVEPYPNVNMQTSMPFYLLTLCDLFTLCWGTQGLTVRSERFWVKHYLAIFHDLLTRLHSGDYGLLHARINHIFPHFTHTPLPTRTKFHKLVMFSRQVILFCLGSFVFKRLFYLKKKSYNINQKNITSTSAWSDDTTLSRTFVPFWPNLCTCYMY